MSFDELLEKRMIEPAALEPGEIADLMRVARRDIIEFAGRYVDMIEQRFSVEVRRLLKEDEE